MLAEINRDRRRVLSLTALTVFSSLPWGVLRSSAIPLPFEADLPQLEGATAWLNSPPLSSGDLRGKVALVGFWTYSCINWRRTLPFLRTWAQKYKEHGLVIIGVHSPEFPFERDEDNVRWAVGTMGINYPVAMDNNFTIWRAFSNEYWPALYFVDGKGRIRHHVFGEGEYDKSETVLQQLLIEAGATGVDRRLTPSQAVGPELSADWQDLKSGENYLGYDRTEGFESHPGMAYDKLRTYSVAEKLKVNHWSLSGNWIATKQAISSNEAKTRITYQFHARDLHLVMGAVNGEVHIRFRVLLDGQPPGTAHGSDVDEDGFGVAREPRLYQLIRQATPIADRRFEIEFLDSGIEAYSFTFG